MNMHFQVSSKINKWQRYMIYITQDYLTIHRLYEVIKNFNGLNEQQNKRRVFAKKRFIDIMKELKNKPE